MSKVKDKLCVGDSFTRQFPEYLNSGMSISRAVLARANTNRACIDHVLQAAVAHL